MKNFLDYLNNNQPNIFDNFSDNNTLNDDSINEGFWDFLTSFFQNLFGNTATDEEKRTGERIVRDAEDEFGEEGQESMIKLIQKHFKNVDDFIEGVESERVVLLKKKQVKDEKQSYLWGCEVLESGKGKFKKEEDKKAIDKQIEEYDKKSGGLWKKKKDDLDNDDDTDNDDKELPEEFIKALDKAVEENKKIVEALAKKCKSTPDNIKNAVKAVCTGKKELLAITEPKYIFAMILLTCGAYLASNLKENSSKILSSIFGVGIIALGEEN